MAHKTPPFEHWPDWTQARFFSFIRSALRAAFNKYPPKYEAIKKAKRKYEGEDKRRKFEYQCNECKQWFKQVEVQVDHIEPAGTLKTFEDLPEFCSKLFCGVEGLQVMCKPCHQRKTQEERKK